MDNPHFHHCRQCARQKGPSVPAADYTLRIAEMRGIMGERRFQREYMNNPVTGTVEEKHVRFGKMLHAGIPRNRLLHRPFVQGVGDGRLQGTMLVGITPQGNTTRKPMPTRRRSRRWSNGTTTPTITSGTTRCVRNGGGIHAGPAPRRVPQVVARRSATRYPSSEIRKKPDKFARIEALQPLFERGDIIFNEYGARFAGMRVLVEASASEKGSKIHDDALDALEGAI
ncbi:MAG: hypothetical protein ACLT1W_11340 [Alistipes onderdonkii]